MKLIFAVLSLVLFSGPAETLLVVDKALKRPLGHTNDFTTQLYLQRNFPVYESDAATVIAATDEAVKWLEKDQDCDATTKIKAGHTSFVLTVKCNEGKKVDISLITAIEETQTSYSFSVARNEYDFRKVQRLLLDFAAYINQ